MCCGRGSPSLSLPQSTRPSKDLLWNILKLIRLALRQAEDVLTQRHLKKQQFLGKTAGKTMSACKCSHPREKTTQEQQKWTQSQPWPQLPVLSMDTGGYFYCTCTCESSAHREPTAGRVRILSIIGKWLILHSLN